jgi:hypothetical protein
MATKDQEDQAEGQEPSRTRLEERAIRMLYSFVERDASSWRFWAKVIAVMFLTTAGPAIAIALYFLGRDLGFFS